jgi:regulatory protein
MTLGEIRSKIENYCAYQDRCIREVMTKLRTLQVEQNEAQQIVEQLKNDGFIDEERYVQSFIRGKSSLKQWGRQKIRLTLLQKGIDASLIDKHLGSINEQQYADNLHTAVRKWIQSHGEITQENTPKLYRHLLSKGYTYEEIKENL